MKSGFSIKLAAGLALGALCSLPAAANDVAQARLARLSSTDESPPFSFTYGDKMSKDFLASWKRSSSVKERNEHFVTHVDVWTDPATQLELRRELRRFTRYPVVEWTLYFKNTGSRAAPVLKDVWALDHVVPVERARGLPIRNWVGSMTLPNDFEPTVIPLGQRQTMPARSSAAGALVFKGREGKPSAEILPYFNIGLASEYHNFALSRNVPEIEKASATAGGLLLSVGWPGQWVAEFSSPDAKVLRMVAGQEYLNLSLKPGESIRTPLITLLSYGGDWVDGQNVWRRWMLEHNVPRLAGGKPFTPHINAGSSYQFDVMRKATVENQTQFIDGYLKSGIPLQYWWMDAGWYPSATDSWVGVGTWEVDKRWPKGLRPVSEHAHARGVETILWFEPERVHRGTWLFDNKPEWLLKLKLDRLGDRGRNPALDPSLRAIVDLGNPDAWQWIVDRVKKIMTEEKIDVYRQDFNISPLPYWLSNDAPDRLGMTENQYVTGYLAFWDELLRWRPGLLIDTCASGGQRNDLETLRRSVPLLQSDYILEATSNQSQNYGLASWMPLHGAGVKHLDPYGFWSNVTPALHLHYDMREPLEQYRPVARMVKLWLDVVAPCYWGDYYPLTPWSMADDVWMTWQYDLEKENRGVVQAFRRTNSPDETRRFKLRGLDASARYRIIVYNDDCDVAETRVLAGRDLMENGLAITVSALPGVANIAYERVIAP